MVKPTLLVLAAGMASRYGSLKQMVGVGPHNEAIIDYSIYDAIRSGFGKIVFVIRKDFADDFRQIFNAKRFNNKIEIEYVYQELNNLPEGFLPPKDRVKPWGTNHAVLMGQSTIKEPFAIINADDFYGVDAFMAVSEYLSKLENSRNHYCMVGYKIENTLSDNGSVSRGRCTVDSNGMLVSIEECTQIRKENNKIVYPQADGALTEMPIGTIVSMNMFGFTSDYFEYSEKMFVDFLKQLGSELKSEYYIPSAVNSLLEEKAIEMKVLDTKAQWFGVTYQEDRDVVVETIKKLISEGIYSDNLWKI